MAERYVAAVEIEQIAPHLWWWTAPHPDWGPDDFKDGQGWARDVSSYALVEGGALVLFDPLVPAEDESTFWAALDTDVDEHGPPAILLTVFWHARSSREIFDRYEGTTVWAHEPSLEEVGKRAPVTNVFAAGDELPGGVEPLAMHHMDEAAFWIPSHRELVLGDSVLGYEGRAELCPAAWLRDGESQEGLEASVRQALERDPEWLLLTHGGPRPASWLQL
jgi:glyoxylase-like metal-dependent hydrolase (beta-lactamase superfamily II)